MSGAQHTPGPWSVDTVRNDGEYGNNGPDTRSGFNSFAILDAEGRVLFDSLNRDGCACEVTEDFDEDGGSAWDAKAKADAARIVQCVNAYDALVEALRGIEQLSRSAKKGQAHVAKLTLDMMADVAAEAIARATGSAA